MQQDLVSPRIVHIRPVRKCDKNSGKSLEVKNLWTLIGLSILNEM